MRPRWHVVVPAALLLAGLFFLAQGFFFRQAPPQHPLVGKPMPVFALPALDASNPGLASGDLRGRPTVVNVFASWCPTCGAEAPVLNGLARRGVPIHGIAVRDAPSDTQAFLSKHGDPYLRVGVDRGAHMLRALRATGVPETYVVDGEGIVRFRHAGMLTSSDVPRLLAALRDAA